MHAHPSEARMARLEGSYEQINERLAGLDQGTSLRFDQVDRRLDSLEQRTSSRFDQVDRRFDQVDRRFDQMDRRFNWLTGLVFSTWITTILGIVLRH